MAGELPKLDPFTEDYTQLKAEVASIHSLLLTVKGQLDTLMAERTERRAIRAFIEWLFKVAPWLWRLGMGALLAKIGLDWHGK